MRRLYDVPSCREARHGTEQKSFLMGKVLIASAFFGKPPLPVGICTPVVRVYFSEILSVVDAPVFL